MHLNKMLNKYKVHILILIIIIQIIIRIYAGNCKQNLFWDEALSYGLMNYKTLYISTNEDFFDNWHKNDYMKEYFEIDKEETLDLRPVYENQKNDVHPPLYYLLLRIAATFIPDSFSKWTGIILNIIISILSTLVLYKIAKHIFKDELIPLLACFLIMTTIGTVETTTFIRMYELCTLNFLLLALWHITYAEKEIDKKSMIILILCVVPGFLTHYYYAIFATGLGLIFIYQIIKKKEKEKLLKYIMSIFIAIILCIIIFPPLISHLLFSSRGREAIYNIEYIKNLGTNLVEHLTLITTDTFNLNIFYYTIVILLLTILYFYKKNKKKEKIIFLGDSNKLLLILFATLFYIIIISKIAPYAEIRYSMPIIPLFMICTLAIIYNILKNNKFLYLILIIITILNTGISFARMDDLYYSYKNDSQGMTEIKDKRPTIIFIQNIDNEYLPANYYYILYFSKEFYYTKSKINLANLLNEVIEDEVYIFINEMDKNKDQYIEEIQNNKKFNNIDFKYNIKDYKVYQAY